MIKRPLTFATLPQWAMPDAPHARSLHEVIALADLEGKWIRLSAADQRALLGFAVFGKRQFCVDTDGTIRMARSTCFGTMQEVAEYSPAKVQIAAAARKMLSPGTFGDRYL